MMKVNYKVISVDELAEYINEQLAEGRSLTRIAKEDLEVSESTIRRRLTKNNRYKRVDDKFIRQSDTEIIYHKNIIDESDKEYDRQSVRQNVGQDDRQLVSPSVTVENMELIPEDKCFKNITETKSQGVILDIESTKYKGLISNYDILMQMIEEYKNSIDHRVKYSGLVIELPHEEQKDFRVTLRLNDVVYKEFKEFADNNKQFTIKELVSQALKEFVDKYK